MSFYQRFATETLDENGTLQSFSLHYPDNFNFGYDVVDAIAAETPHKRCLVWCDRHVENVCTLDFEEMSKRSTQAANLLRANGIKQGDRVLVMLKRHCEYWFTAVALHKLGAVLIPATHQLTTHDLEYRINTVGVSAVVVTGEGDTAERLDACQSPTLTTKLMVHGTRPGYVDYETELLRQPETMERVETRVTDPMLLYFTSGTTGQPKAVMHNHTYALSHIITAKHWQNVQDGGLHFSVSDTGWGKASWGKIYGQWLCGAAVMVYDYDQFAPRKLAEVITRFGVNTFCAPPTVYRALVKRMPEGAFDSVSYAVTAGEALNPEVATQFQALTGLTLHEGFGQTESVLMLANLVGQPVRPGSMGKPTPLYHVELLKPDGTFAADGEAGEIVVVPNQDGIQHGIFMGYCGDDALYAKVNAGGVYHTRDLARRDEDGFYWYISRTDDVIKSSGYRVSPLEVENVLMTHPCVMECAVTGVPDEQRGFAIQATVVLSPGYQRSHSLSAELKRYLHSKIAAYQCPKSIDFVDVLPKTISGKIRRVELRAASTM